MEITPFDGAFSIHRPALVRCSANCQIDSSSAQALGTAASGASPMVAWKDESLDFQCQILDKP